MTPRLVVLERDGVIGQVTPEPIRAAAEWAPIPGSLEAIVRLSQGHCRVVVATNQDAIGRGLLDVEQLNAVHTEMLRRLADIGGGIEAIFFCPHGPRQRCACRMPKPGMLLEIGERLRVPLRGVPVVGDGEPALLAAHHAEATPVLVLTGRGQETGSGDLPAGTEVHADLAAFADAFLAAGAATSDPPAEPLP